MRSFSHTRKKSAQTRSVIITHSAWRSVTLQRDLEINKFRRYNHEHSSTHRLVLIKPTVARSLSRAQNAVCTTTRARNVKRKNARLPLSIYVRIGVYVCTSQARIPRIFAFSPSPIIRLKFTRPSELENFFSWQQWILLRLFEYRVMYMSISGDRELRQRACAIIHEDFSDVWYKCFLFNRWSYAIMCSRRLATTSDIQRWCMIYNAITMSVRRYNQLPFSAAHGSLGQRIYKTKKNRLADSMLPQR